MIHKITGINEEVLERDAKALDIPINSGLAMLSLRCDAHGPFKTTKPEVRQVFIWGMFKNLHLMDNRKAALLLSRVEGFKEHKTFYELALSFNQFADLIQ